MNRLSPGRIVGAALVAVGLAAAACSDDDGTTSGSGILLVATAVINPGGIAGTVRGRLARRPRSTPITTSPTPAPPEPAPAPAGAPT